MNAQMTTVRLLGAAQLLVFVASLVSDRLLTTTVGTGSVSDILLSVSSSLTRMRISNLVALINSLAIVLLGVLFYTAFYKEYRIVALLALICFVAEAITLAVSKIGAYGLTPLSRQFVEAGTPKLSHFQALGEFFYQGVDRLGYLVHMLFFCVGGILWYYLLLSSGAIPRALSLWGLVAVSLLTIPVVLQLYDRNLTAAMVLGLPYAPYEVVLGLWLVVKGFS
jgi:hypothetical protein